MFIIFGSVIGPSSCGKSTLDQVIYNTAYTEYNNSIYESFTSALHPHSWWSTLKTFLFDMNTSLPLKRTQDGSVTFDPSEMAKVFSTVFQRKQCDQVLNLPPIYFSNPKLTYFIFESSEIKYQLKELDSNGDSDSDNMFPLFLKKTTDLISFKLANVTPNPKGQYSYLISTWIQTYLHFSNNIKIF